MIQSNIIQMVERLDASTYNHSVRVAEICKTLETQMGYKDTVLSDAGLIHDIGKYYISSKILDKHDKLTDLERLLVDLHPYIGYQMLMDYHLDPVICSIILYHHGDNPPVLSSIDPIRSDDVMQRARLLKSVDVYEALTTDRPYRRRLSAGEAIDVMRGAEGVYDTGVMDILRTIDW